MIRLLFAATLVALVIVGLAPFHWSPPRVVENGARLLPDGEVRFSRPGIVRAGVPRWLTPAIQSNSFVIRLTLRSFSASQKGPARIFTVSRDEDARNVTIAQEQADLVIRLRRGALYNGRPDYVVPDIMSDAEWHHIDLVVRPAGVIIRWDGETVFEESLPAAPLRHWNPRFRLVIGNELTGNRPWLGEVSQALVEVGGKQWDCLSSSDLQIPNWYISGLQRDYLKGFSDSSRRGVDYGDVGLNVLGFIPIGFLLAKGFPRVTVLSAFFICAAISLSIELAQICFEDRCSSVLDLAANTLGGGMGAIVARNCRFSKMSDKTSPSAG